MEAITGNCHILRKNALSSTPKSIELPNLRPFFPTPQNCHGHLVKSDGDFPPAARYDMGSDGEFEFRRTELAHMAGCREEDIGDEEVMQSYKERWEG